MTNNEILDATLEEMIETLTEARKYIKTGESLAAMGTLGVFEYQSDNVRAVIRMLHVAAGVERKAWRR